MCVEAMRHDMLTEINDPQHHTLDGVAHSLRPIKTMHVDKCLLGLTLLG